MAATAMILGPGETLGKYRILEVVSIGGMAIVYRAEHLYLDREVALKVIAPPIAADDAFRTRFRSEGRAAARLDHPNIVAIHDSGEVDGRLFLAMRFISGETLGDRIRAGDLTAQQAINLLAPIADALDAAHAVGIVHRDVKPQNIIISDTARPYLADFGIAKGVATTGFAETRGFIGTCNYAAPEQILGRAVTPATDIYALTAVLYHCLTGRPPYLRETDAAVLHAHVYEPPPTVVTDHPGADRLSALIARGMAKEPRARFASASELMREATGLAHTWPGTSPQTRQTANGKLATTNGSDRNGAAAADDETLVPAASNRNGDPPGGHPATPVTLEERAAPSSEDVASVTSGHTRPVQRGHRLMLGIGALTALLIAIAAAAVLRSPGSPAAPLRFTASSAPFTVAYERPWHAVSSPVVGSTALSARAHNGHGRSPNLAFGYATLTAGQLATSSPIPGGVPPALAHRYGRRYTTADAVVAGHVGRRYTWSMPGGVLVAYVIPLRNGDAAAICRAPRSATSALRSCGLIVRTADVSRVQVVAPGPDTRLAHTLSTALKPVSADRSSLDWRRSTMLTARASRAAQVASTESHAAAALTSLTPPPRYEQKVARLGVALNDEAAGIGALTTDARSNSRRAYVRDSRRVSAASRRLNTATAAFAGYQLRAPILRIVRLAAPPRIAVSKTPSALPSPSTTQSTAPTTSTTPETTPTSPQTTPTRPRETPPNRPDSTS